MTEIQRGEIAMSIIGLSNVINKTVPRWTLERMREFDGFQDQIAELASKAIAGEIPLKSLPREHKYAYVLERLSESLPEEDIRAIQSKFPTPFDELSADFVVTLQNSWNHLKAIFPVSEYKDFVGVKNLLPTGDKTWAFFNKLLVLNDPLSVYMLISSGAMLRSQAQVVRDFFPTLSAAIDESLYTARTEKTVEKPNFRMPERTKTGLGNWLGRRTVDYDPAPPAPVSPVPQNKSKVSAGAEVALSPSQRVTDGGNAAHG